MVVVAVQPEAGHGPGSTSDWRLHSIIVFTEIAAVSAYIGKYDRGIRVHRLSLQPTHPETTSNPQFLQNQGVIPV